LLERAAIHAASGSEHSFFAADLDMWAEADLLGGDEIAGAPLPTQPTQELPEASTPLHLPPRDRHAHRNKFTFPTDQLAKRKR